jgi:FAD/FMN-containing dehydrogenase
MVVCSTPIARAAPARVFARNADSPRRNGDLGTDVAELQQRGGQRSRACGVRGEEKYRRLVALKDKYDPTNVFRMNQNVPPTKARALHT